MDSCKYASDGHWVMLNEGKLYNIVGYQQVCSTSMCSGEAVVTSKIANLTLASHRGRALS